MKSLSSDAYDLPSRVRMYDSDMDIMHPLRQKMIDIALTVLPFSESESLTALDLGIGTGVFSEAFLRKYPNSNVVAIDGASAMIELARSRLGDLAQRVRWVVTEFQSIPSSVLEPNTYDVVISSYALHHLNADEKRSLLTSVVDAVKDGGWLLNADLVVAAAPDIEQRIQEIRVSAVTSCAPEDDQRFRDVTTTRQFLDDLEAAEHDQPQPLDTDLRIIRESGMSGAEVFWKEYREVVIGGTKTNAR